MASSMPACGDPTPPTATNIEIDYYAGITPKWGNITFNFAGLYYSYPGSPTASRPSTSSYFEAKAGASYTTGQWTFGINDYWSPDNFQTFGNSNAIEGILAYAFQASCSTSSRPR